MDAAPTLPPEKLRTFRAELDALRMEQAAQIGPDDARYIRRIRAIARASHVAGRVLIHCSLDPVTWSAGVLSLAAYKMIENMELGHNVLHGQYDFLRDPTLSSRTYEWDIVAPAKSWKRAHNATHHVYTNVIGRDGDFGYDQFRFSDEVPWRPRHLLQPITSPLSGLLFQWSVAAFDVDADDPADRRLLWRKAARKTLAEYVLYPALAGPMAPKVALGNAVANGMRNLWAYAVIYCGHLTERAATFPASSLATEDRGRWYLRQVTGSGNFEIGRVGRVLSGHLGYQIEHHLFPNLPAWRYPRIAPRVRDICRRHGVPYDTGTLRSQFTSAMRRLVRHALPPRASRVRAGGPGADAQGREPPVAAATGSGR